MKIKKILLSAFILATLGATAQVSISGEFRPRTEYKHGQKTLFKDGDKAGFATSLRSRVNFSYQGEGFTTYLSIQDVTVFGENRQLIQADANNSLSIFEAWAHIELGKNYATKIGRQMIAYDDQRIMGSVGWAQQARTHDAFLLKHKSNGFSYDIGLAYNQNEGAVGSPIGNNYTTTGFFSYKTMQYLWANKKWDNFAASILVLNNGFQKYDNNIADGVNNLTTYGTHLKTNIGGISFALNVYGQSGDITKNQLGGDLNTNVKFKSAYLASLDATFKASEKITLGIGYETISGDDSSTPEKESFFPVYGTNHKFNGFMDYFYVGNHGGNVGLNDFHISSKFKLNSKSTLFAKVLNFSAAEKLASGETQLGTEIDLVYTHKLKPAVTFQLGYSQLFASDGMEELKGAIADGSQNWAWAMITIKPKFLN